MPDPSQRVNRRASPRLITRVGASLLAIQIFFMSLIGVIYYNWFTANIDERQAERLHIATELIRQQQLNITALTDQQTMSLLMGEEISDAMLISPTGTVAFSLNPQYRRRMIADIPFLDENDLRTAHAGLTVKRIEVANQPYLASTTALSMEDQSTLVLYFRIGVTSAEQEKRNVIALLLAGLLITTITTSAVLTFVLNRIVLKRIRMLALAARRVQAGEFSVRPDFGDANHSAYQQASSQEELHTAESNNDVNSVDEIGVLSHALNGMTNQLKDSIFNLEQRLADLDRAGQALRESEDRYRLVFENSPVSIWEKDFSGVKKLLETLQDEGVTDIEAHLDQRPRTIQECANRLKVIDVNKAAMTLLDAQRKDELLGDPSNTITSETADAFRRQLVGLWNGQTELVQECVVKTLSGSLRHVTLYFAVCPGHETTFSKVLVSLADISERKQAEEDVRRINQELEQRVAIRTSELLTANKELEAFSYSVSHDLRVPLRHIDGYLALLRETAWPHLDDESRRHIDTMAVSIRRMGTLIEDLLAFSRMGRQTMSASDVDLGALVADVVAEMEPETRGREIHWHIDPLPVVKGDPSMLRVVMVNLISNALKFTQKRAVAVITIGCLPERDGETVFFVKDNGAGFDMRHSDKLFGVFQRLHRIEDFQGTGIGLANVFRVVDRHGGRTWAEGAVDFGATFYVALPKRSADQA